jgi:glycosyltransferase involved in cell wall biosynthesis
MVKGMNRDVSVIIPTLNEEGSIRSVLADVLPAVGEVIVVDGHSNDKTAEIARAAGAKVFFDSKGKGSALRQGMALSKGSIVIMMDADGSHRLEELSGLISAIRSGSDACFGSRFMQGGGTGDMTLIRKAGNKFFVFLVNLFWGSSYSDLCYGYRGFSRNALQRLKLNCDGFGIETEISIQCAKKRLKVIETPSYEKPREYGKGKLRTARDGFKIFKTILGELLA